MIKNISFFGLVLAILLSSCNDSKDVTPVQIRDADLVTSEDITTIEYLQNELEETVDGIMEIRDPGDSCVTFTLLNPQGEFPNTLIIDFGGGCEGTNGHVKSGMIIVEQSAPMNEPGAIRIVSFKNFFVDSVQVAGTKSLTNTGVDTDGNITLVRSSEIELIFPNGMMASRIVNFTIQQVAGADTDQRFDDVFEITGSAEGVNRHGHAYTATITDPLVRRRNCRWLVDGVIVLEVTIEGEVFSRSIDYGHPNDGECDRLALVTLNDGTEKTIRIHRRWW